MTEKVLVDLLSSADPVSWALIIMFFRLDRKVAKLCQRMADREYYKNGQEVNT